MMKATGVVRKTDHLGRICLPIEIRRNFGIEPDDSIEIFVDENQIVLRPYGASTEAGQAIKSIDVFSYYKGLEMSANEIRAINEARRIIKSYDK